VRREYFTPEGRLDHVDVVQQTGGASLRYAKLGLVGVKDGGFPGWAEEDAPRGLATTGRVPTDAFLDTVPDELLDAMALKIQALSTVSEADAGK
jgi:hypothetical protein